MFENLGISDGSTSENNEKTDERRDQGQKTPEKQGNDFNRQMAIDRHGKCEGQISFVRKERNVKTMDNHNENGNIDGNEQENESEGEEKDCYNCQAGEKFIFFGFQKMEYASVKHESKTQDHGGAEENDEQGENDACNRTKFIFHSFYKHLYTSLKSSSTVFPLSLTFSTSCIIRS